jgi:serine protease Do
MKEHKNTPFSLANCFFMNIFIMGSLAVGWLCIWPQQQLLGQLITDTVVNAVQGEKITNAHEGAIISNAIQDQKAMDAAVSATVIEKVITSGQLWRPIQESVQDTVVQVYAHISAIDILRPYMPPAQGTSMGSGFFINEYGYIITNAHVVNQAQSIWIQIPSLGKDIIDVVIVGISPERDIALLRVTDEGLAYICAALGSVPFLTLGNSDMVRRSDEVLTLGYPLGQQMLKSTTGVVSGRERHMIQISAPINPGSSGGPLLDVYGKVVGINTAGILDAQNVGYAIPINILKVVLDDLFTIKLLRKPFLGILFTSATDALVEYLGNLPPGGCYIVEVIPDSNMHRAGVQRGDMIYAINGFVVDKFGEMNVPWSEDKLSITELVNYLSIGDIMHLVLYRNGQRIETKVQFDYASSSAIKQIYPGYEPIDYEIFGGMVVMELTKNHIAALKESASGLAKYLEFRNQQTPVLLVTHIFANSQLHRSRVFPIGTTLNEVNSVVVKTLDDFRNAIKGGISSKFLTILASDNVTRASDHVFLVLPLAQLLEEEKKLSYLYRYPTTPLAQDMLEQYAILHPPV